MSATDWALAYSNVLGTITLVLAITFIWLYASLTGGKWWDTNVGRWLMSFAAVIAVVFALSFTRFIFGASLDTAWFIWARSGVFTGVPLVMGYEIKLLLSEQGRKGKHRDDSDQDH